MTKKIIELVNVKQKFLFNGPQKNTGNIIKALNDEVLSSIDYNAREELDNKAKFGLNVLINKDNKHLILQVAFIYGYVGRDKDSPNYYSTIGKFESLIRIQDKIDDNKGLSDFINENILVMIEPIMNYISKSINEMTADTLNFPTGINMYSRFEKMLKNNKGNLLK